MSGGIDNYTFVACWPKPPDLRFVPVERTSQAAFKDDFVVMLLILRRDEVRVGSRWRVVALEKRVESVWWRKKT